MANAAERITDVLTVLVQHPAGLSASEVGEALGLSRTAAARLLTLMVEAALAERDPDTQKYVLGLDLWLTGTAATQRLPVVELSRLPMAEAVAVHGTPLFVGVNRGSQTYVLRAVERVRNYPIVHPIALKQPIPELATGKAILAFDAPNNVAAALAGLFADDAEGRGERERLVEELERTRERGFALKYCQDGSGVNGIAVPIIDRSGYAVAGLSASLAPVPVERYTPEPVLSVIKDAADVVSRNLGYARFTAAVVP
ncbi:MAG TPA: IclR family transcriptional regulator C-terminal domain-containing protein [Dehalococcoidia bacterium]|nr:IclR family transcriptional regulator C-terminal domain-containing protein [Dehalococcoidia bacterium]